MFLSLLSTLAVLVLAHLSAQTPPVGDPGKEEIAIKGRVIDTVGRALIHATVSAFSEPAHMLLNSAKCDSEGRYVLKLVPPEGGLSLVVTAPGYNIVKMGFSDINELLKRAPQNFTLDDGNGPLTVTCKP